MLILTRKKGESIRIGDDIVVTIVQCGRRVKVGVKAPQGVLILRTELDKLVTVDEQPSKEAA